MKQYLLLIGMLVAYLSVNAQSSTITTTGTAYTGSNGLGAPANISFVVNNTNSYPIAITGIGNHCTTADNNSIWQLYISATSLNGSISDVTGSDWTLVGTSTATPVTVAGITLLPFANLNLIIPANTGYRLVLRSLGPGNTRYSGSSAITPNSFTAAGVQLLCGDAQFNGGSVGYSGTGVVAGTFPRYYTGFITFEPAGPCTDPPVAGIATTTNSTVCLQQNFTLSLSGITGGTGQSFQWQHSPDSLNWSDITGATNATFTTTQSNAITYYRCRLTCGSSTVPSAGVRVNALISSMNGIYTVNTSLPATSTNFHDFGDFLSNINCRGISGNVQILLSPGTYTGNFSLSTVNGNSTNSISISSSTNNAADVILTNGGAGNVLTLTGINNIAIQNITFSRLIAPSSAQDLISLQDCSNYNVTNNIFNGIAGSSSANNRLVNVNGTNAGFIVQNQFNNGYYGVFSSAVTGSVNTGLNIIANIFTNTYLTPIHIVGNSNVIQIDGNIFTHDGASIATTGFAINLTNCENFTISNNKLTGWIGITALFLSNFSGSNTSPNRVYNNSFNASSGNATPRAIHFTGSTTSGLDYVEVYHNSFRLLANTTSTNQNGIFYFSGGTTAAPAFNKIILKNNVISIANVHATPSAVFSPFYLAQRYVVDANLLESNHNDFYFPSSSYFAYLAATTPATTIATLANWTTTYGLDANSFQADPVFTSSTDNTPLANSPLNNAGTPIPYITVDINGLNRSTTTPDIGAHEILVFAENLFALDILSPIQTISANVPNNVSFRFVNIGTNTVTNAMMHYQLGNSPVVSQAYTGSLAFQDTATFTFSTPLVVPNANELQLKIWTSLPNGLADGNPSNDSLSIILCLTLPAGTYTLGNPNAQFPTFSALNNYLSCAGISGPVVFEVDFPNNISNEPVTIDYIPGASAINTITFKGNNDTIEANPVSGRYAVVLLNGAKHIIFRDFYIRNFATTNIFGMQLMNGADSNVVRRNTISVNDNVTATTVNALILGGSLTSATAAGSASYNLIDSNLVSGGNYGIRINGNTNSLNSVNNLVLRNEIRDFYSLGISLFNTDGAELAFNDLHRLNRAGVITTAYFIDLATGAQGSIIRNNEIHDSHTAAPTNTSAAYGIRATSNNPDPTKRNRIYNNLVYKLYSNGITNGILYNNSHNADIYYNTIVMDFGTATAGASRGVYFQGTCSGVDFRYNNVYVSKAGTGDKQGIFVENTASNISSERNNFYINAPSGLQAIGNYGSTNFTTLAQWQTANSGAYDQLSVSVDPLFVDSLNNNYQPQAATLDGAGIPVSYIQDDFFGNARNPSAPDLGAIEFTPSSVDLGLTNVLSYMLNGIAVPLANGCFSSLQNNLHVEIVNNGISTVTTAQITFQVNSNPPVTETINTPIASGAVLPYTFTAPATFVVGLNSVKVWVNALNDGIQINDTAQAIATVSLLTIHQVPYSNNFETSAALQNVCGVADVNSKVEVLGQVGSNNLAITGNGSLVMSGTTSGNNWVAPTATNWMNTNQSFVSTATFLIRADTLSRLKMSFNLQQRFAGTSLSTNFRVLVNNQAIAPNGYSSPDFRPANAAASSNVLNLVYNLDAFVGDTVNITLFSNVRYDYNSNPIGANIIDDLQIFQPIEPVFDSVSRISNACVPSARTIQAHLRSVLTPTVNLKYHINNGPVQTLSMTQSGSFWTGTIPAAAIMDSISYYVEASVPQTTPVSSPIYWYKDGYLAINAGPDQNIIIGNSATLSATIAGGGNVGLGGLLWSEIIYFKGSGSSSLQATFPTWLPNTSADDDYFEITNTSNAPISLAGKRIRAATGTTLYDFTFPTGALLGSGQVAVIMPGSGTNQISNNLYFLGGVNNNTFSSTSNPAAFVLYDNNGTTVIDAVRYNSNDFPLAFGVPVSAWNGTITGTASFPGLYRKNELDSNLASDWAIHSPTNQTSIGYLNPGINVSRGVISWTDLAGNALGNTLSITVSPTVTTTYIVTIDDGVCIANDTVVVNVGAQLPDVGVSRIMSPTVGSVVTTPQAVTARVKNYGAIAVSGFDITYTVNPGGFTNTNTISATILPGDSLDFTFGTPWTPGVAGTYNLCVFTLLTNDNNNANDTSCHAIGSATSIENLNSLVSRIYPNPTASHLTFEFKQPSMNTRVLIYDEIGRLVHDKIIENGLSNSIMDLSHLSDGLYQYRIISNEHLGTGKFIIKK